MNMHVKAVIAECTEGSDNDTLTFPQVLGNFRDNVDRNRPLKTLTGDPHRVVNFRQVMLGKLHVDNWTDDLNDVADVS